MNSKKFVNYDTAKYEYVIDWGNGASTLIETFLSAQNEVNNEVLRTIIPRYQNDIVIKYRKTDEVKAVLPWIGIINYDDPNYWCPSSKIRPATYGEWIVYDTTDDGYDGYF